MYSITITFENTATAENRAAALQSIGAVDAVTGAANTNQVYARFPRDQFTGELPPLEENDAVVSYSVSEYRMEAANDRFGREHHGAYINKDHFLDMCLSVFESAPDLYEVDNDWHDADGLVLSAVMDEDEV